ncbi:2-oxoacid:acceptor oxidoreductase subunit alpha [bacterium]|nr:2-oxoacid:acceptor oxidoreductase subunit alpha [bacterium]
MLSKFENDVVIVLAGEAGQGIQSIEGILSLLLKRSGYNYFSTSEFMSRVRGGVNSTEIRISSQEVNGFRNRIDILIPLSDKSVDHLKSRLTDQTLVIGEKDKTTYKKSIEVPFSDIAKEIGNKIFSNTVAAGFICGLLNVELQLCKDFIAEYFASKKQDIIDKNIIAISKGHKIGKDLEQIKITIDKSKKIQKHLLLTGAEAVSLGALAGGCNFVCAYPMSPATSVLENMASYSKDNDIIVEQVEDEIGVINMTLGAWYAGARAMATTSGGGFALMSEGISLCAMIESPLVMHIAQRPGPATGLPTRTEQGDLNLVLYAGHGDFPRIILAPGTLEEAFYQSRNAFNMSAKYQMPVFILTDQFFVDSKYNIENFDLDNFEIEESIVKTNPDYQRFAFTKDGLSPRGIPNHGKGLVCVDSDEHDESGHITEDFDIRVKMVDKRKHKLKLVEKDITPPKLIGKENYKTLVICWGSTFNTLKEALEELENEDISLLHFSWIYPLHKDTFDYLNKADKTIIVENNSSGQMAQLIRSTTGFAIDEEILKYNGLPFSVEELKQKITNLINKEKK